MAKNQRTHEEEQYEREFAQKVSAPDAAIQAIQPGDWIQVKWMDNADTVVLVMDVERKRKRVDRVEFFDPAGWDKGSIWGKRDLDRIVHVLGPIKVPAPKSVLRIVK